MAIGVTWHALGKQQRWQNNQQRPTDKQTKPNQAIIAKASK